MSEPTLSDLIDLCWLVKSRACGHQSTVLPFAVGRKLRWTATLTEVRPAALVLGMQGAGFPNLGGGAMNRPVLNPDEKRIFDAIAQVDDEWSTRPRCAEKAGAKAAIGAIWHRLGWTLLGIDENEKRAKARTRGGM